MSQRKAAWTPAMPQVRRKACCDAPPPLSLSPPPLAFLLLGGGLRWTQRYLLTFRDPTTSVTSAAHPGLPACV